MNRLARFAGFGKHDEEQGDTAVLDRDVAVERMEAEELREPIIAALRGVHDPEIPVNIYDLGLIYSVDIAPNGDVAIDMTLTAPACPVAGMMPIMVKDAVSRVDGVGEVRVELVWDPPWGQENMSDEARLQLGLM
ncbi:SUF system Fe-S cluster assembly protein [Thiocystis violascens]|uniref:FeS assembly SUF system protein n=1 Tax=Thiocystis violascens (strain ATCC 17096 / DSM 198 / 6111) TaxID=765911 RepID=I3Y7Z7_THIV6|nr:SUF system Fe-S cluster assembly protein [Thiocystis violascens]AFL73115.1 FeS assembly SUF system protein [Thiocystis violascens DSM 198]